MTDTAACPVRVPEVALIHAVPCRAPVIKPVELTDATVEFELDHVTSEAGELAPELFVILADACTEVPDAIELVGRVIDREEEGSVLVEPDPPQAANMR
jgi:hypothetical protein